MNFRKYYRLRSKDKVEGFAKEVDGQTYFKAYNDFLWHKTPIKFDTIDIGLSVLDKRNRRLYTNDVVLYKVSKRPFLRKGFVAYRIDLKEFGIVDQTTFHFTPFFVDDLCLFKNDRLEIISHLFTVNEKF